MPQTQLPPPMLPSKRKHREFNRNIQSQKRGGKRSRFAKGCGRTSGMILKVINPQYDVWRLLAENGRESSSFSSFDWRQSARPQARPGYSHLLARHSGDFLATWCCSKRDV